MQRKNRRSSPAPLPLAVLTGILGIALIVMMAVRAPALRADAAVAAPSPAPTAPTAAGPDTTTAPDQAAVSDTPGTSGQPAPADTQVPGDEIPGTETPDIPQTTPEPEPEYFTISLIGDCSLASNPDKKGWAIAYESVINGDYSYPFANTKQYFEDDYLTIANMEGNLSDKP